jgi:hypothetical protein
VSARPELDPDLAEALALLERIFGPDPQPLRVLDVHPNRPRRPRPAPPQPAPEAVQPSLLDPDPREPPPPAEPITEGPDW